MIHVCYSNRTEELLRALVQQVDEERRAAHPLVPIALVVPNRNVETYVKLGLAQASGIAANLKVTFLRKLLARVAESALPGARAVEVAQIHGCLLTLLHDDALLRTPGLGAVQAYLMAAGARPDTIDRRRCQLAAELARLFDEYANSRSQMLAEWQAAGTADVAGETATRTWQRRLWLAIFGRDALLARRSAAEGVSWLPLGELIATAEARGQLAVRGLGSTLHVFGVSYVARAYHRMLAALARHMDVRIYTLNPCREFWEDVETRGEARRRTAHAAGGTATRQLDLALGDDPFGLDGDNENLALRLWGRPGRENVRLLNQLTDGDFEGRFVANRGPADFAPTLLGRLQDDILERVARVDRDPAVPPLGADRSITVLPCPGVRRELEIVAAEIWAMMRADPTLRFNDIAVIVPEGTKASYLSHVRAVFGESHGLPHSVIDLPQAGGHRLGEAFQMLLALPLGSFSRHEWLPLLTHPSLMARFPGATATQWVRLCDELGILHGADHGDHRDTYIERDILNWDQGLRRLALGALMAGPRSGDSSVVDFAGQSYLPADQIPDDESSALAFATLVRSLIEDARFAAGVTGPRQRPLADWMEFIRGLLTGYLIPADEAEETLVAQCLREIEGLEDVGLGPLPVSYRIAAELVQGALAAAGGARGQYLANGVTVAAFVPMRAIPFRAVFALGLGQGQFPSSTRRAQLDLRGGRRHVGDVTPREQDLYMFLETVLCARERLVLSYVARDELTGEPLQPSSVLLELGELLRQGHLSAEESRLLFDANPAGPLRRFDDEDRLAALPLGRREWAAKALGQSLRDTVPMGAVLPDIPTLRRTLPPEIFTPLAARLGIHTLPAGGDRGDKALPRLVVSLADIRQFLEDPLQGSARFRLRLREIEGEEDLLDRQDEPFETDRRGTTVLLRRSMIRALTAGCVPSWESVARTYHDECLHEELAGRGPTGLFGQIERGVHEAILRGWWADLSAIGGGVPCGGQIVRFGRATEHEDNADIRDAVTLDATVPGVDGLAPRQTQVALVGRTGLQIQPGGCRGTLLLSCRRKVESGSRDSKRWLAAFVDHLALAAAGLADGPSSVYALWSNGQDSAADADGGFGPISADRARAYLAAIVCDMFTGALDVRGRATGVHPYLLPCEAVFESHRGSKGRVSKSRVRSIVECIESLRDQHLQFPRTTAISSALGPVPEAVERHDPPSPDVAADMVRRRFGLFFELSAAAEETP